MSIKNSAGQTLTQAQLEALTTVVTYPSDRKFTADIWETFDAPGTTGENYRRLRFKAGQTVQQATIDKHFTLATVDGISAATGPAAGGQANSITGTNLYGVTAITFGGTAVTNLKVVSKTRVTFTTPAHAAGAVSVVVTDDGGTVTKTTFYTYV